MEHVHSLWYWPWLRRQDMCRGRGACGCHLRSVMVTKTSRCIELKRECTGSSSTSICNERARALKQSRERAKSLGQTIRDVGGLWEPQQGPDQVLLLAPQDWQQDSGQDRSSWGPTLPLTSCLNLHKLFTLPVPQFPHCKMRQPYSLPSQGSCEHSWANS